MIVCKEYKKIAEEVCIGAVNEYKVKTFQMKNEKNTKNVENSGRRSANYRSIAIKQQRILFSCISL